MREVDCELSFEWVGDRQDSSLLTDDASAVPWSERPV